MDILVKATVVFALLPLVGSGITLAHHSPLLAQSIVPTDQTTQTIVSDQGVININGGTQSAVNLFHSFDQFHLDQGQTANFIALPSTEAVIGQVIGGTASTIDGLLQVTGSNADLYLVNPAGLLFGPHARLDLGGAFTATTATHLGNDTQWFDVLSNPDYSTLITPPSHFGFSRPSSIVNHGDLTVVDGQPIRLLAPQVTNTGTLKAPDGEITLFAAEPGQIIRLGQNDRLLSLEITSSYGASDSLPAMITGGNLDHSSHLVIGNNGEITLGSSDIPSESPLSFNLNHSGNISTQGVTGGEINLLGNTIQVTDSLLDASGNRQGGHIRIGGDYQGQGALPHASQIDITNTARLSADATQGNGGQVIVWSDGTTKFDGTISAQSATGHGGLVETSGRNQLTIGENATVITAAPQGEAGLWLLDPTELTVVETSGVGNIVTDTNDITASTINASTIVSALNSTNITLQATKTINLNTAIDASDNSISSNLFLDTANLNLNERVTLQGSGQLSGTANTVNVGINGSIQNGVDAVIDGGTVNLAATTYREGETITLDHPLTLIGQNQDSTFISGDADNNGLGDHRVLEITSSGDNINLIGLTIQDGFTTLNGAGLINAGKNFAISNVTFTNNEVISSSSDGGAIHNTGFLTIANSIFENNRTSSDGGAIDIGQGSVDIMDSHFINNTATGHGGAIDIDGGSSVTIINSQFNLNRSDEDGGAIFNAGILSAQDTDFTNNVASDAGGGIFNQGNLTLNDNVALNNNQAENGGGLWNEAIATLEETTFTANIASNDGGGLRNSGTATLDTVSFQSNQAMNGGGLYNQTGSLSEISNGYFLDNLAQGGGGIFNQGQVILLQGIVANNQATLDGGGGIYNPAGGDLTVSSSLISNNSSTTLGGGLLILADGSRQTSATISNSAIVGNRAASFGGGIELASLTATPIITQVTVTNSTISGNQASIGGGIRTVGPITLLNTTIADNIATSSGGGLSQQLATPEVPSLINTIVARNTAPSNPDVEGQFIDQGHNLIGINQGSTSFTTSTLVGTASQPLDPRLTRLNNLVGSLPSHQLVSDSPAVNAGDNTVANVSDQHGQARIVGNTVDIGAVESDILPTLPLTLNPTIPTTPTNPTNPTNPSIPDPQTPQADPIPPNPLPFQSSQAPDEGPTHLSDLNDTEVLLQEEKTTQPITLESEQTTTTRFNGRLRYFDEEAFQELEENFSKEFEDYWQLPPTQSVTLPDLQETLQQANKSYQTQSAVIYAVYVSQPPTDPNSTDRFVLPRGPNTPTPDDQLLLIMIPATGEPIQHLVNVSRAELTQQATLFRLAASDPDDSLSYKALARQMYDWLVAPIKPELERHAIDHVMYSVDQGLRTIPLNAMMEGESFVIEQYGLSVIPSMGLMHHQFDHIPSTRSAIIAGADQFQAFDALPAVTTELDIVAQNTQALGLLFNETFTLDNFLELQQSQQPNFLHLATHAEFNAGHLDKSFIQFWDSQLTFNHMRELSWSELELLILSACGTALSSVDAELGFTGLATAMGIETAMGSLWNISDVGTLALMAEFYPQLTKSPLRVHALQKAQISLIRGNTQIKNSVLNTSQGDVNLPPEWNLPAAADFSHPFYWAGFTMVGNPWH